MTCPMMMSLGVYLLGTADAKERQRLEAHLPACQACRAELMRLAPLPGLLAGIPEAMRDTSRSPGQRVVSPAGARSRALPHGGARRRWAAAAAACLAAAAVTSGLWLSSSGGGPRPAVVTLAGANPATHVSATATLTATSWGSSIALQISGLPENVDCRLVVRSLAGKTEVSGVWNAWQKGPANIPASASWLPSDIASLQVTTTTGNLLTISAHHPAKQADRGVTR